jgi:mRNA interferase RelE/StbE
VSWEVTVDKAVLRRLARIPEPDRGRLTAAIVDLRSDPEAKDILPLTGRTGYRMRVGRWRVLLDIDFKSEKIFVYDLGPRGDVYK